MRNSGLAIFHKKGCDTRKRHSLNLKFLLLCYDIGVFDAVAFFLVNNLEDDAKTDCSHTTHCKHHTRQSLVVGNGSLLGGDCSGSKRLCDFGVGSVENLADEHRE